ncbi:MAG: gluconate:H+ symporter [Acidobacteriota bacterium]
MTPALSPLAAVALVAGAIIALLVLVLGLRLHAFIALLTVSLAVAVVGGIPLAEIASTTQQAMAGTLGYIAVVIGLGAIFGQMLDRSGAARRIATTLLATAGERRAPAALGAAGLLIAIPVFFDVAFILMLPLVRTTARRCGKPILTFALPLLAGLAVAHAFIPPTPGPVAVAGLIGAELGWVIVFGLAAGIPALWIAGILFGGWISRRIEASAEGLTQEDTEAPATTSAPGFTTALALILLPLGLIVLATVSKVTLADGPLKDFLGLLGHPFSALLLTVLLASVLLSRRCGWSRSELERMANRALEPVGAILLVTGAGGVLGKTLLATGAGEVLATALESSGLPLFLLAFLLALMVRLAQGSATVSMVTSAGLIAPVVEATAGTAAALSAPALGLLTVAIAAGATACSHVNDSGFWLVGRFLGLDERQTLRTWTAATALIGLVGLIIVLILAQLI